jgi:flagellar hook assembly protein FlgD
MTKIFHPVFFLAQNYPNPFNPSTTIEYELPITSVVELAIFNTRAQKVKTLVHKKQPAGAYATRWNGDLDSHNRAASGIYFYQLQVKNSNQIFRKKMILVR